MKYMTKNSTFIVLTACSMLFSCQDEWNKHYDNAGTASGIHLYELIKQDENLSKFSRLIEISGYDKLLSSSQTYTVWAPHNEGLSFIDPNTIDSIQANLLVSNQIARFNNPTSNPKDKSIRMINKKNYFYSDDGGIKFGGIALVEKNRIASNGLLHTTEGFIPYFHNLYEFICADESTSFFASFISQFQENIFDSELSIPIDSENGMIVYDTITSPYNRLFEHRGLELGSISMGLGAINNEDSVYTMLMPTNKAWDAARQKIAPYFKIYNSDRNYADSVSQVQTSLAIINNLIFRGKITNPYSCDSLISTFAPFKFYNIDQQTVMHNVNDLFEGSEMLNASNGLIYLTDNLNLNNTETWNPPIMIEAESTIGRRLGDNTSIVTHTITLDSPIQEVSGSRYIFVESTTTTAQASVTFQIPDVLSCKYNIYVDVLPSINSNNAFNNDSTRLAFVLVYMNESGTISTATASSADLITNGTKKIRMKVFDDFEFPVSNFVDQLWYMNPQNNPENFMTTTSLTVRTNVANSEVNNGLFRRRFAIDNIIFEPIPNK